MRGLPYLRFRGGLNDGPHGSILMPWPMIIRAMTRSWKDIQLKNITSKSLFRLRGRLLAGVMMVLPVAGVLPVHDAHAADQLGEKVGTALQKAQTDLAAKKYPQAMADVDAADAVTGKSEYESYTIAQMRAAVAAQSGNVPAAISAYDKLIASPARLPPPKNRWPWPKAAWRLPPRIIPRRSRLRKIHQGGWQEPADADNPDPSLLPAA